MKAKSIALIAHQLRSPLTIVKWYVELLLSRNVGALNKKQDQYLQEIYQANKKMLVLINSWSALNKE